MAAPYCAALPVSTERALPLEESTLAAPMRALVSACAVLYFVLCAALAFAICES